MKILQIKRDQFIKYDPVLQIKLPKVCEVVKISSTLINNSIKVLLIYEHISSDSIIS